MGEGRAGGGRGAGVGMTGRAALLVALAAAAVGFSAISLRWETLSAAVPPLALLAVARVYASPADLRASRRVDPDLLVEGGEVEVEVNISGPRRLVLAVDVVPEGMDPAGASSRFDLTPGDPLLRYRASVRRGVYRLGPVRVAVTDPLGLLYLPLRLESPAYATAVPRVDEVSWLKIYSEGTRPIPGEAPSRVPGPGTEFRSIREALPGDPLRTVNWKATARRGKVMVNEHEAERRTEVMILLDTGPSVTWSGGGDLLDHACRAAMGVAAAAMRMGHRVGLLHLGSRWIPPEYGPAHLVEIARCLAAARPTESAELRLLVRNAANVYLTRGCQVILVSPMTDPTTPDALAELASRGFKVLVVSPNPITAELSRRTGRGGGRGWGDPVEAAAASILSLEREAALAAASAFAAVLDWDVRGPVTGGGAIRWVRVGS